MAVALFSCGAAFVMSQRSSALSQKDIAGIAPATMAASNTSSKPIDIAPNALPGQMIYIKMISPPGPPRRINYALVVKSTGNAPDSKPNTAYQITGDFGQNVYGCQLSPDGNLVLFAQGYPFMETGDCHLFFLNLKTRQLEPGPANYLQNPLTQWSPDSRCVAYAHADYANQAPWNINGNLDEVATLSIFDLTTRKHYSVAKGTAVRRMAWTRQHTLLYTRNKTDDPFAVYATNKPSIYEADERTGHSVKIIPNASDPSPSPDGNWIAFYGWVAPSPTSQPEGQQDVPRKTNDSQYGLCIFDRKQQQRRLVFPVSKNAPRGSLAWSSDSKRLFVVENFYRNTMPQSITDSNPLNHPGYGEGRVQMIDVPSLTRKPVGVLKAVDAMARTEPESQFKWNGVSKTGQTLYFYVNEYVKPEPGGMPIGESLSLRALDVQSGLSSTVWTVKDMHVLGIEWHEQ